MTILRKNYLYSYTHFWVNIQKNIAICGMSDYKKFDSGELVFIELPKIGKEYQCGNSICIIESVKSVSDLYSPLSGKILTVNEKLKNIPNIINTSSYDDGWIFKISIKKPQEINNLLSSEEYSKLINPVV